MQDSIHKLLYRYILGDRSCPKELVFWNFIPISVILFLFFPFIWPVYGLFRAATVSPMIPRIMKPSSGLETLGTDIIQSERQRKVFFFWLYPLFYDGRTGVQKDQLEVHMASLKQCQELNLELLIHILTPRPFQLFTI